MEVLVGVLGREVDGRPLYGYRITDRGYEALRQLLGERLRRRSLREFEGADAALFCMFGAEWWRREHERGPWSWDGVIDGIGARSVTHADITTCVERGLRVLGRPLYKSDRGNEFLITLACEGGLPLRRIGVEGANIRVYFRCVLDHFESTGRTGDEGADDFAGVAKLFSDRLPESLRREVVFRLSGELVGRVWALRDHLSANSKDALADLDRAKPNWRDSLPIVLSDEAAKNLLRGLVKDVALVAAGQRSRLRFAVYLELASAHYARPTLLRRLEGTPSISDATFQDIFGATDALRLRLNAYAESGEMIPLGSLGRGGDSWSWEPDSRAVISGTNAEGHVGLVAIGRGGLRLESDALEGTGRLGPLPWVFRQVETSRWELVATGSVTRRETELLVAVPKDARLADDWQSEGEILGRRVIRITEPVRIECDAGAISIRTGQVENSACRFQLLGKVFRALSTDEPAWCGVPTARGWSGAKEIPADLEVKTPHGWESGRPGHLGSLVVRIVRHGDVVFQDRILVVPEDLAIEMVVGDRRRSGVILITSARVTDAGTPAAQGFTCVAERRAMKHVRLTFSLTGEPPSARLPLGLWFGAVQVKGTVPFPASGMRFERADGSALPSGSPVHVGRLGGVRAIGLAPSGSFHLTLHVAVESGAPGPADRTFPLKAQASGEQSLALSTLHGEILAMLDSTESLDAEVCAWIWEGRSGFRREPCVVIRRYDWRLTPDRAEKTVVLDGPKADELDDVIVEARPFGDVSAPVNLPRFRSGRLAGHRWVFDPDARAEGPWLITARHGGWYRCRPLAFYASGPVDKPAVGLTALFSIADAGARTEAIRLHLEIMAMDAAHPDWPVLDAHARLLGDLPASTFDVVRALVRVPRACAQLALRVADWSAPEIRRTMDGLEELCFLWTTVPLGAWAAAFEQRGRIIDAVMPEHTQAVLTARCEALAPTCPTVLPALYMWWRLTKRAGMVSLPIELRCGLDVASAPSMLEARNACAGTLVANKADEDWPKPTTPLAVPRGWRLTTAVVTDERRGILDAPVYAAAAALGHVQPDREAILFLDTARSFDEDWFVQCFMFTFSVMLGGGQGVWRV